MYEYPVGSSDEMGVNMYVVYPSVEAGWQDESGATQAQSPDPYTNMSPQSGSARAIEAH